AHCTQDHGDAVAQLVAGHVVELAAIHEIRLAHLEHRRDRLVRAWLLFRHRVARDTQRRNRDEACRPAANRTAEQRTHGLYSGCGSLSRLQFAFASMNALVVSPNFFIDSGCTYIMCPSS